MRKSIITLGTFDGVHQGHQVIVRRVARRALQTGARSVVLAFDMPPRHAGESPIKPVLLTTLSEKLSILRRLGIDKIHILVFDARTASIPAEMFFRRTIVGRFHAREMIVGPRVAFGKDRLGRLPLLRRLGRRYGVTIRVVRPVQKDRAPVSSRFIRMLLRRGNVDRANRLLGYPYSLAGSVVHGEGRGRALGYPTANLQAPAAKILPPGVFWVKVLPGAAEPPGTPQDLRRGIDGLCNVGTRPTFAPQATRLRCEVFIFGAPRKALYGKKLRVVFLRRIRGEKRFPGPQALQRQIARDFRLARRWAKDGFSLQNKSFPL